MGYPFFNTKEVIVITLINANTPIVIVLLSTDQAPQGGPHTCGALRNLSGNNGINHHKSCPNAIKGLIICFKTYKNVCPAS